MLIPSGIKGAQGIAQKRPTLGLIIFGPKMFILEIYLGIHILYAGHLGTEGVV